MHPKSQYNWLIFLLGNISILLLEFFCNKFIPTYRDEIMKLYLSGKSSVDIAKYIKKEKEHKITPDAVMGFILKE